MENESSPDDKEVDPIDSICSLLLILLKELLPLAEHHITLHMQGPYVFKIEMDKKEKEDEENGEKILPHGNISFAGRSRLLPSFFCGLSRELVYI
jgi:hypothetical protein